MAGHTVFSAQNNIFSDNLRNKEPKEVFFNALKKDPEKVDLMNDMVFPILSAKYNAKLKKTTGDLELTNAQKLIYPHMYVPHTHNASQCISV